MGKSIHRNATGTAAAPAAPPIFVAKSRALMIDHYWQWLLVTPNRNERLSSPATVTGYVRCARVLAQWLDANGYPGDLTAACEVDVLNQFFKDYFNATRPNGEPHGQNGTAFYRRNLRTLFKWIEIIGGPPSPYRSPELHKYKEFETKPKTLSLEFIEELLDDCKAPGFTNARDEGFIRTLLEGLRIGEALPMAPHDVPTLDNPVLRIIPFKGELNYADGSGRRIQLADKTIIALQRWLRVRADHPLAHTQFANKLWLGKGSAVPFNYNTARLMLIRRSKRLGYDQHATAHMFRHTFVHDYKVRGGDPTNLEKTVGWTTSEMHKRYSPDLAEDRAIEAKRKLGPFYG